MMKLDVGYPELEAERTMIGRMHQLGANVVHPEKVLGTVIEVDRLVELRSQAHGIDADQAVIDYIVEIVRGSRSLSSLSFGASPRAGVMLLRAAKAESVLRGRSYVTPDTVRELVLPVLRHRIRLTPEAEIEGLTPDSCLDTLLKQVSVPR
jgi:MoxR-like ATPase